MEQEIHKLVVAVTQASGPRKIDWSTIIAGVMLIMAIGSAVFWPLNQTSLDSKMAIQQLSQELNEHTNLQLHPVGNALVNRLEFQLQDHINNNTKMHQLLEESTKERIDLVIQTLKSDIRAAESKTDLHNERLYSRVVKLEEKNSQDVENELAELRVWRFRAMNGEIRSVNNGHVNEESPHPSPASAHNPVKESISSSSK
jgi:hypothetical protein